MSTIESRRMMVLSGSRNPSGSTISASIETVSPGDIHLQPAQQSDPPANMGISSGIPQMNVQFNGSNYSSPRSSIASHDSKGSSPGNSVIQYGPPPPYDYQKYANLHSSFGSQRSSLSGHSGDSIHSSPRGSVSSLSDRYLNSQSNAVGAGTQYVSGGVRIPVQNETTRNSPQTVGIVVNDGVGAHGLTSFKAHPAPNLMNRFNEHAPPMYKGGNAMPAAHMQNQVSPIMPKLIIKQTQVSHHSSGAPHLPPHGHSHSVRSITHNINISAPPSGRSFTRLPMQTVTHQKGGQSDAEKALEALTQQLERDMQISDSTSSYNGESDPSKVPPPPYYGPHYTHTSSTAGQAVVTASFRQSTTKQLAAGPKSPLPLQMTGPPPKGPTEAQRKVEALTKQLENEMESNPQGEYYGK